MLDLNGLPVPRSEAGKYNVRWSKQLNILPFERNNSELIFDNPPSISTAQIVTPVKIAAQSTASAYNFTSFTSSADDFSIVSSDFFGYDRDFASSKDILDPRLRAISVNPTGAPFTMNGVSTAARSRDEDVANGFLINYTTRFNTLNTLRVPPRPCPPHPHTRPRGSGPERLRTRARAPTTVTCHQQVGLTVWFKFKRQSFFWVHTAWNFFCT